MDIQIVNIENIVGTEVRNTKGQETGKIEAIMLDKMHGQIAYMVLSFNGYLARGNKLFAMPWNMVSYDDDNDCFTISVDRETLINSPAFDKNNLSSGTWNSSIQRYYGIQPDHSHH